MLFRKNRDSNHSNYPSQPNNFENRNYISQNNSFYPQNQSPFQNDNSQEKNNFINREVRKIFGYELFFLPLKMSLYFLVLFTIVIVSLLWVYGKLSWPNDRKYFPYLAIPALVGVLIVYLAIKNLLDYLAVKKSVKFFQKQLEVNSIHTQMPPMIPWLVRKINQKDVNAIWVIGISLLTTIILVAVFIAITYWKPSLKIDKSKAYIAAMTTFGALFVLSIFYKLVLKRRINNIEAIFGNIYHQHIDIGKVRFRRHLIWAIVTVVLFLLVRRIGKKRNFIKSR
ncbi:MSC_0882 family membrane protein [Mesomycoplasma conjunctivae]|uniref:MSC_0882 family membrane protein n=1 Tax=Mesomycoplasma conjunctivae TaxID=45361 RepID=UPI003DA66454